MASKNTSWILVAVGIIALLVLAVMQREQGASTTSPGTTAEAPTADQPAAPPLSPEDSTSAITADLEATGDADVDGAFREFDAAAGGL